MARLASALIDDVLNRVRDPNGLMHTRAFVLARISDAQQLLNGLLGIVTDAATLTLNPGQCFYQINASLPNAIRILDIRDSIGIRSASPVPSIHQLLIFGARWFREMGPRVEAWTTVGRDLLVVYPAPDKTTLVTVYYVKQTTVITVESTPMEFESEYTDMVATLAEAMILLRQRDLQAAQRAMARLSQKIAPELAATRLHTAPTELQPQKESNGG